MSERLSPDERACIRLFAGGMRSKRRDAVTAYRRGLWRGVPTNDPFMRFMAEIDTPTPDLALRAQYREKIVPKGGKHE